MIFLSVCFKLFIFKPSFIRTIPSAALTRGVFIDVRGITQKIHLLKDLKSTVPTEKQNWICFNPFCFKQHLCTGLYAWLQATLYLVNSKSQMSHNILVFREKIHRESVQFSKHFKQWLKLHLNDAKTITILPEFSTMDPVENSGKVLFHKASKITKVSRKLPSVLELMGLNTWLQACENSLISRKKLWNVLIQGKKENSVFSANPLAWNLSNTLIHKIIANGQHRSTSISEDRNPHPLYCKHC